MTVLEHIQEEKSIATAQKSYLSGSENTTVAQKDASESDNWWFLIRCRCVTGSFVI